MNALFAGDLMNQCTASAYGLLSYDIPYFGIYGACSSSAEGLCLASMLLQGGIYWRVGVVVSSHYASAERQFRFPLEYGAQRTPTSQWTVTGAGAFLLAKGGETGDEAPHVRIADVMPGRSVDGGIKDLNNMGAAMAPAAVDSLLRYFGESGTKPQDYDLIVSGDLGYEGHGIVTDLLASKSYDMRGVYDDCGLLIYDRRRQDMHAGGSGCGCSASVLAGFILPEMLAGNYKNVLFMATGALMSPSSVQQGGSIPGIAHIVHLRAT